MDTQNSMAQCFRRPKIKTRVSRAVRSLITTSRDLSSHLCIISARRYYSLKKSVRYWGRHKRTFWKRQLSTTVITLGLFLLFSAIAPMLTEAATFTDLSVPNGDVSTTGWSTVGTNDSSCASGTFCNFVDEGSTVDTADYVQAPASGAGGELLTLDMENTFVGDSATQLVFYVNARAINDANGNPDLLELRLSINGADLATTSQTLTTTYTWYSVTYTGSWTQADIDSMQAKMTRQYQGGGNPSTRSDDTQVAATYVDITYEQSNTFEQSAYRWFGNDNTFNGVTTFGKVLGGVNDDQSYDIVSTDDGGYAVAGYTDSYGAGGIDQTLVKYDSFGVEQWSKTWGGIGNDIALALIQTSDGGFIVAGDTNSYGSGSYDQSLVKYNSSGVEQWSKTWGGGGTDSTRSLIKTSDGGFAVAGYTASYGAGDVDQILVKYDSSGVEQWSKTWGGIDFDEAHGLVQTADGGYVVAGFTANYGSGGVDQTLVRYNSSGVEQWSKTWGDTGGDYGYAIVQADDGGFAVAGYTGSYGAGGDDQLIVKYDSSGVEQWSKTWGGAGTDIAYNLFHTSDGGYAVVGRTQNYGAGSDDQTLVKYDSFGVEQWSKTWGGAGIEYARSVTQTSDAGFAVAGYTDSYGAGSNDQSLIKYDSSGTIANCTTCTDVTITEGDITITEVAQTHTESNQTVTEANQTVTEADQTANSTATTVEAGSRKKVNIGASLAAQDTATTAPNERTPFRLRANAHVGVAELPADSGNFKLQYAQQGADAVCDPSFSEENYSDVLRPNEPTISQTSTISNTNLDSPRGIHVADGYAYTTGYLAGTLNIIDVSNPSNITEAGSISTAALSGPHDVYVSGDYAYVVSLSSDSLAIFDVSDPANPTQTGTISNTNLDSAAAIHVIGNYAYIASHLADSLTVVDVSDPANPTQTGTTSTVDLNGATGIYVAGDYAYVANQEANAMTIVDVSNPASPTQVGTVSTADMQGAFGIHKSGDYVYMVSQTSDSLTVIDVSTPASPNQVSSLSNTNLDGATAVHVAGSYAYVASQLSDAMNVIDISDPTNPTETGFISNSNITAPFGVYATGGYAYVTGATADSVTAVKVSVPDITFYDNTNLTDGMALASSADDPQHNTDTNVYQSYVESNNFTNPNAIPNGSDGLWDFSLVDNSAPGDTSYCFRIVNSGGSELNTYSSIAEITTSSAVLTQDDYRWFENQDTVNAATWVQTHGGPGTDYAQALVQTSDGGYAVAGRTDSYGTGGVDQSLVKYDASGTEQWSKTWGGTGSDYAYALVQTSDGGYAVAGRTDSYGAGSYDQSLVTYDTNGVEQWSKTWGGTGADYAEALVQTTDGGYAVAGHTGSYGVGGDDQTLVKYDSNGNIDNCPSCVDQTVTEADQTVTEADQTVIEADQTVTEGDVTIAEVDQTGNFSVEIVCGPVTFAKALGGTGSDYAYALVQTADGGYAVAGYTDSYGAGGDDQTLVKYDSSGVEQWSKTWGGTGADYARALVQTTDGGFAVAGYTDSYGAGNPDQTLVKYDSSGTVQWSKTWGGTNYDYARALVQTSDGGYAVAGDTIGYGAGSNDQTLVKYDSSGTVQWSKTWGGTNSDVAQALVQTSDGGYAVTGSAFSYGAGITDQTLVKYDSSGTVQWSKTWGGTSGDVARALVQTSDGGYAVAGEATVSYGGTPGLDQTLVKYDSSGIVQWSKTWGDSSDDVAQALVQTSDGGYTVAGYTASYGAGANDLTLVKYDSSGTEQWSKTWGGTDSDEAFALVQTTEGGYAVAGRTNSYGAGVEDQTLVKYDANGNIINCGSICGDVTITETDQTVTEADQTVTEADQTVTEADQTVTEADQTASTIETEIVEVVLLPIYELFVGAAQAALSTLYDTQAYDELVRLRSLVAITNKSATSGTFKLQYAPRFGQCDTSFTGENYVDVPGSYMSYFDNTLAVDGDSIEPSTNDPSNGNTNILQSYVEANNFSLGSTVGRNENALWDFAIKETGTSGGSYCFRIVHSDGTLLDNYTHIPELGVPAHTPQQLRHGRYFDTAQQARPFYW